MKPINLIVIGGSISTLKLLTIICFNNHLRMKLNISLISPNEKALFFPLIPNFIEQGCSKEIHSCNTKTFCLHRGIKFINGKVEHVDTSAKTLAFSLDKKKHEISYDICIDGSGISTNEACLQATWDKILSKAIDASRLGENFLLNTRKLGIAEFEAIAASKESFNNYKVNYFPEFKKTRAFSSHPILSFIESKNITDISHYDSCINYNHEMEKNAENITQNSFRETNNLYINLGSRSAKEDGMQLPSAQYSSFDAKLVYFLILKIITTDASPDRLYLRLKAFRKNYKPRGIMIYLGKRNALLAFNRNRFHSTESLNILSSRPIISGKVAAITRLIFYRAQKSLFYSEKKPLNLYSTLYKYYLMASMRKFKF